MENYVIVTDSGSDISPEVLSAWDIISLPLTFRFSQGEEMSNYEMDVGTFYKAMREGKSAKTSAVNYEVFRKKFTEIVQSGKDILYLGLSSGISSTYSSARAAGESVTRENPTRRILTLDTKSASAGLGLIVYLTCLKKKEGASLDDAYAFAERLSPRICHWFTVDDLAYLKRGGRISPAVAFFGNMLGIKPVLYMDSGGFLKSSEKVRGRRGAIESLAQKFGDNASSEKSGDIFISHADCISDAKLLSDILFERYGCRVSRIFDIGAVIGAHAGPGTLALFFVGNSR